MIIEIVIAIPFLVAAGFLAFRKKKRLLSSQDELKLALIRKGEAKYWTRISKADLDKLNRKIEEAKPAPPKEPVPGIRPRKEIKLPPWKI